jgi:proteasome lid subunit RPN8/RPN11
MNLAQHALMLRLHSKAATRTLRYVIDRISAEQHEQERCGVILANGSMIELPNSHPDPVNRFRMSKADIDARLSLLEVPIFAWWHTHYDPDDNPLPSKDDRDAIGNLVGMVIHCATSTATLYNARGHYRLPC